MDYCKFGSPLQSSHHSVTVLNVALEALVTVSLLMNLSWKMASLPVICGNNSYNQSFIGIGYFANKVLINSAYCGTSDLCA